MGDGTECGTWGVVLLVTSGDVVVVAAGDGNSDSKLPVDLPAPGTTIEVICDGTLWILSGHINSITAPAFADQ